MDPEGRWWKKLCLFHCSNWFTLKVVCLIYSSMILGFRDLQVGQDRTVVTSFCVQLAARRARGLWTDANWWERGTIPCFYTPLPRAIEPLSLSNQNQSIVLSPVPLPTVRKMTSRRCGLALPVNLENPESYYYILFPKLFQKKRPCLKVLQSSQKGVLLSWHTGWAG